MTARELLCRVRQLPSKHRSWDAIWTRYDKMKFLSDQILLLGEAYVADIKGDVRDGILVKMCKLLKETQLVYFGVSKIEYMTYGLLVNDSILISYLNREAKEFPDGMWTPYSTIQELLQEFYHKTLGKPIEVIRKPVGAYELELFMFDMNDIHKPKEIE